jgi:hypothetical protein
MEEQWTLASRPRRTPDDATSVLYYIDLTSHMKAE